MKAAGAWSWCRPATPAWRRTPTLPSYPTTSPSFREKGVSTSSQVGGGCQRDVDLRRVGFKAELSPGFRTQHGGEVDVYPAGGCDRPDGSNWLLRPM